MMTLILAVVIAATPPVHSSAPSVSASTAPASRSPAVAMPSVPQSRPPSDTGAKPPGGGTSGGVAGAWRLTEIGGRVDCTLTLRDDGGHPSREIQAPIACQRAFPPLKELTAWSVSGRGALVFTGGKAKPLTFTGPFGGPYSATAPDGKAWRLTAAPEKPAAASAH